MSSHRLRDVLAGAIVFLIALPLCLGIAQASGAPPFAGLLAGIIGGLVIGTLSKSHLSVSGPAAGLIAIVAGALISQGQPFGFFLCSVIIAGVLQFFLGLVRAGGLAHYFPSSVIEGMLAGIGLTIILKEVPNALGYSRAAQQEVATEGERSFAWFDVTAAFAHINPAAICIALLGLGLLIFWSTRFMRRWQMLPAGLLVVVLGTGLNQLFATGFGGLSPLVGESLVNVPVPQSVGDFLGQFTLPDWRGFLQPGVWITGVVIAVVASLETLLCIEATDKLDPLKRFTPGSAELKAQGVGNLVSGFLGGLPITSVIVRSSANINAGARTKLATVIHGALLLLAVVTIAPVINFIPTAALSAILIFTGYRLCRPAVFRHMWKEGGLTQFLPFLLTAVLVAYLGLLQGVAVGLVAALIFTLRQNMRIPYFYQRNLFNDGELIKLTLAQEVSFLNKAAIKQVLQHLPSGSNVVIDASKTEYIDFDVLDLIRDFVQVGAPDRGVRISLIGFQEVYRVPPSLELESLMQPFADRPEVPQRHTGGHEQLLQQLRAEKSTREEAV